MVAFLLFLVLQVSIPLSVVAGAWRRREWTWRDWVLTLAGGGVYLAFTFLNTPWGRIPYVLRYVWPLLFGAALVRAALFLRKAAAEGPPAKNRTSVAWTLFPALILGLQGVRAVQGRFVDEAPVDVRFPLRDGVYLVHHGGNATSVNYHNVHEQQKYALDISGLNAAGLTSWGVEPKRLDRYAIWDHTLYSPCDGVVLSAVDGLPDHVPPDGDPKNPAGNHVELETNGIRIFLAHMQKGSVRVKPGDRVREGDPLGKVGNSGNTSEPHLHIHAVRGGKGLWEGKGVPLTFGGRFLVRNDLVFGKGR